MSDRTIWRRLWGFRWRLVVSLALPAVAVWGWQPAVLALVAAMAAYCAGCDENA